MRRFYSGAFGAALAFIASIAVSQAGWDDRDNEHGGGRGARIVGAWEVTTTLPPFVFHEFASFGAGGTYIGNFMLDRNSANPTPLPAPLNAFLVDFSTKYGSWKPKPGPGNTYDLVLKEYLFAGAHTPTSLYGVFFPGQNVGQATVRATPALSYGPAGDTLEGPFTVEFKNMQGAVVFTGAGTFLAKRLK